MFWNWTTAFEDMESLRRDMDSMMKRTQRYIQGDSSRYPALNIYNHEDKVMVLAQIPGVAKEDLDIQFAKGKLTIAGERRLPDQGEQVVQLRHERGLGRFEKSIHIPIDVDVDAIQAKVQDGILSLELPKAETAKAKQITVQ